MRSFDKLLRYSANIGEMMERMGIEFDQDIEAQFEQSLHAVIQRCQLCRSSGLCSEWLARAPVMVSRAPPFCPYANRLDGLGTDGNANDNRACNRTVH